MLCNPFDRHPSNFKLALMASSASTVVNILEESLMLNGDGDTFKKKNLLSAFFFFSCFTFPLWCDLSTFIYMKYLIQLFHYSRFGSLFYITGTMNRMFLFNIGELLIHREKWS